MSNLHLNTDLSESQNQELKQIPDFILRLLMGRGLSSSSEIKNFLYPKITSLGDPFKILNMGKAVERLVQALDKQQVIAVYGDYDLDGTFGLAILKEAFNKLGFKNVIPVQPYRHHDGYGLHSKYIEQLKNEFQVDLIVTVDVGITAVEACQQAKELGVDVIVTDHHLAQEVLPDAYCILNPNQPHDSSGFNYLCGAGVGLYLVRALRKALLDRGDKITLDIKDLLPYYAIATITDMVPLVHDNRLLLKFAFESFKKVQNVGLKSLLAKLDLLNKKLDTEDIGIKLAPKINALGRLEKNKRPMELLFIENPKQAESYVEALLDLNIQRRSLQDQGVEEVAVYLRNSGVLEQVKKDQVFFYCSENIHPGVTGLIANHFMNELDIPCLIGSVDSASNIVTASGRKPDLAAGSLVDMVSIIRSERCDGGGHACAMGMEFHFDDFNELRSKIANYFQVQNQKNQIGESVSSNLNFDLELNWSQVSFKNYLWLEFLEPFGVGFEEPKFLLKNVSFIQMTTLKNKHFKLIAINSASNEKVDFLLFNPNQEQKRLISESIDHLDVVVKMKRDKFRGTNKVQFLIEGIHRHGQTSGH